MRCQSATGRRFGPATSARVSDRATAPANQVACSLNDGNDPNYTGRAWAAVVAYLIGDDKFLYE